MSKAKAASKSPPEAAPTMIIPRGTEIEVDPHGQLSIRAPGNLVIQHSGAYGTIESVGGSIRIDHNVEVEAVTVRCSDTCFVQGSLTAWKVVAQSLHVEETAQAHVVLQETDHLEIGRDGRVVGNFGSEKELFLLFSRFARQVRSLPFYFDRGDGEGPPELSDGPTPTPEREAPSDIVDGEVLDADRDSEDAPPGPAAPGPAAGAPSELPEPLFFARVLLERDAARQEYGPTSQRVLQEIVKLLQDRDLDTLRHTHRTLFSRILEPRPDVRRARELVANYYGTDAEPFPEPEPDPEDQTIG